MHRMLSLFLFVASLVTASLFSQSNTQDIQPVSRSIEVQTEPGFIYLHVEGNRPDKRQGKLRDILYQHPAFEGDGSLKVFASQVKGARYHLVEVQQLQGKAYLNLTGKHRVPFKYYINQGENTIKEGEVLPEYLNDIPAIYLPPGDYTLQVYAEDYEVLAPVEFSILSNEEMTLVDVELSPIPTQISITAEPEELTTGKGVILHRVDPETESILWSKEMTLWGSPEDVEPGDYVVEFPPIQGYQMPGDEGFMGRYRLLQGPYQITGEYTADPGSLLIEYSTYHAHPSFQKIQLQLQAKDGKSYLFPGGSGKEEYLVASEDKAVLRVNDLPAGTYELSFKEPNAKTSFYQLPEPLQFVILPGEEAALDVSIGSNSGRMEAFAILPSNAPETASPTLKVTDRTGKIIAESNVGELEIDSLLPGAYTLSFSEIEGFQSPDPILFEISPGSIAGPFEGYYSRRNGAMIITYDTEAYDDILDEVRFWISPKGSSQRELYPQADNYIDSPLGNIRKVIIPDLPVGAYQLAFVLPTEKGVFEPVPELEIEVKEGQVTEIQQTFKPRYGSLSVLTSLQGQQIDSQESSLITLVNETREIVASTQSTELSVENLLPGDYLIFFGDVEGFSTPEAIPVSITYNQQAGPIQAVYQPQVASFNLESNRPDLRWVLMQGSKAILSQKGNSSEVTLPAGEDYQIRAAIPNGWQLKLSPSGPFALEVGQSLHAKLDYVQEFGSLAIEADLDPETEVAFRIQNSLGTIVAEDLLLNDSASKQAMWESEALPIGQYTVSYDTPPLYLPLAPQRVEVTADNTHVLTPNFVLKGHSLTLSTNLEDAFYTLSNVDYAESWEGAGLQTTFSGLRPGAYLLVFAPASNEEILAPEPVQITIPDEGDVSLRVNYAKRASIILSANVNRFSSRLTRIDGAQKGRTYTKQITGGAQTFALPEGQYRVQFLPITGEEAVRYGGNHPQTQIVALKSSQPSYIHGIYQESSGSLKVETNLDQASFTVTELATGQVLGPYMGKSQIIPFAFSGEYEVRFNELFGFQPPEPQVISVLEGERAVVGGEYTPIIDLVEIPRGPVIVGDTFGEGASDERPTRTVDLDRFMIGSKEVTNEEFALWLTDAYANGLISLEQSGKERGRIYDLNGRLLFETTDAAPNSKIYFRLREEGPAFYPQEGFTKHPVTYVSWYGADLYCEDQGLRLPSEAEWEMAAAMAVTTEGEPLKKYRFATQSNQISEQQANYMSRYRGEQEATEGTKPVGYYDGVHLLTSSSSLGEEFLPTQDTTSPSGCYDMSGNVREWVKDWYSPTYYEQMPSLNPKGPGYGSQKVTKGGSYTSFSYELRCSARMPLDPETTDAFTGFRVALTP